MSIEKNYYNEHEHTENKDELLKEGLVKVVYDDGFKTNIVFCSMIKIMYGSFLMIKESKGEKKQIFPIGRIVRIQYIDDEKVILE